MASSSTALLFCVAVGLSSLAMPLVALESGHRASHVGFFVAFSGAVQILSRTVLGAVLRRFADRAVIAVACLALLCSHLVLLSSESATALAGSWALQGFGRGWFWTAAQTHVTRELPSVVQSLAVLNLFGSVGQLLGPVLGGLLLEASVRAALATGAVISVVAAASTFAMTPLPPFQGPSHRAGGWVWVRSGMARAYWANGAAGAWRGLMDSFVPVVLQAARHSASTSGLLISIANGAAVVGAAAVARLRRRSTARAYSLSIVCGGVSMGLLGYVAQSAPLTAVVMASAGLGAGALQTLGPAFATHVVEEHERGDGLAAVGTMRTIAQLGAPLALAAAVAVMPLSLALLVAGTLLGVPGVASRPVKWRPRLKKGKST